VKIRTIAALTCFLSLAASAIAGTQKCGTIEHGGSVSPGFYSGGGGTKDDAEADLLADMGVTPPSCAECTPPAEGCVAQASVEFDDSVPGIDWGTPHVSFPGIWSVGAEVTSSFRWDAICTTCGIVEPS